MKNNIMTKHGQLLTFLLIFIGQIVFGQTKSIQPDELLFEKGFVLEQLIDDDLELDGLINNIDSIYAKTEYLEQIKRIKETTLKKAHKYYQELVDSFPKSNLLFRALNNKGL